MSIISNLIRKTVNKDRPLDILTLFYDGRFDIELLKTGHNFYGVLDTSAYPWPGYSHVDYPNLHMMNSESELFTREFDLMLLHSRDKHSRFSGMPHQLHIPAIQIDHDILQVNPYHLRQSIDTMPFESVGCGEKVSKLYRTKYNIEYGLDNTEGQYEKDIDILICGTFANQDAYFINQLKKEFNTLLVCGRPNEFIPYAQEFQTYEEYKNLFKRAKLLINLPSQANINYEILWALKYGCLIVSPPLPAYNVLEHNKNCLIAGNLNEIAIHVRNLILNPALRQNLLKFSTNLSVFDEQTFVESWNELFEEYRNKVFIL